jgi:hypothetical protein
VRQRSNVWRPKPVSPAAASIGFTSAAKPGCVLCRRNGAAPDLLASLNQSFPLKEELSHYRQRSDRLERIESHVLYRAVTAIRRRLSRR